MSFADLNSEDFQKMNVYNLRNFLMSRGIAVSDSNKKDLVKLAEAAATMGLPSNVEFHDDVLGLSERLTIKGIKLPDPFAIPGQELSNKMDNVPPFGIEDIFNFLIFKSSDYDRQKVASYKAFEEYGLFEDGYVQDLKVKEVSGHFVFVGKVKPTMKPKTKEGEKHYKLWFVIDGDRDKTDKGDIRWKPTAGSVFSAYCYCPGGQDGACKHIAATLYSLHDCLHPMSGPTDKLCYWRRKLGRDTDPSPISEVVVKKASTLMKKHGFKGRERKRKGASPTEPCKNPKKRKMKDNIEFDPRAPADQQYPSKDELKEIKGKLKQLGCTAAGFLLSDSESDENEEVIPSSHTKKAMPILYEKVNLYVKNGFKDPKKFLETFTISTHEVNEIESLTKSQSQSENWKMHRKGLITSTKLHAVVSRQTTIDKDPVKSGDSLARQILEGGNLDNYSNVPVQLEHGRVHENEARKEYAKLMITTHENCDIESSGLVINKGYPFLAASPDDIRTCKCCGTSVVEYKCPFKNKEKHPREAFLEGNIGGIQNADGTYSLKPNHKYYYQVQGAMAATNTKTCDFVVYTLNTEMGSAGSIFIAEIAFNPIFWATVVEKASRFFRKWVLPLVFDCHNIHKNTTEDNDVEQNHPGDLKSDECTMPSDQSLEKVPEVINLDKHNDTEGTYVIATIKGVPLFQEDLDCLREGNEITDNIVGVFMRLINEQFMGIENLTIAESLFYLSLTQNIAVGGSVDQNFQRASSYLKKVSPEDHLIVPICAHGHWFVIIFAKNHAIVMDSLSHRYDTITRDNEIDSICNYLKWKNPRMNAHYQRYVMKTPQQNNNTDCGIYLVLNVASFLTCWNDFVNSEAWFLTQDFRNWFGEKQVKQERKNMKNFIVNHASFKALRMLRY